MTVTDAEIRQATRNVVIASVFGRIPVGEVPGAVHRRYLMERRGDGVEMSVTIVDIVGRSSLMQFRPFEELEPASGD